jgi:hypothetical protein
LTFSRLSFSTCITRSLRLENSSIFSVIGKLLNPAEVRLAETWSPDSPENRKPCTVSTHVSWRWEVRTSLSEFAPRRVSLTNFIFGSGIPRAYLRPDRPVQNFPRSLHPRHSSLIIVDEFCDTEIDGPSRLVLGKSTAECMLTLKLNDALLGLSRSTNRRCRSRRNQPDRPTGRRNIVGP